MIEPILLMIVEKVIIKDFQCEAIAEGSNTYGVNEMH